MQFVSYSFLLFLAVVFIVYYLVPGRFQWIVLLVASYVFYLFAGPKYLIYIMATTLTTWLAARQIDKLKARQDLYLEENKKSLSREEKKLYKTATKKKQRLMMLGALLLNLGILAVVKYTNFAISNINAVINLAGGKPLGFVSLVLPLGISFYTFRALSYLIDVYRKTIPAEKNVFKFALFVSFFPQLIQGPISRFTQLESGLFSPHRLSWKRVSFGLQRILWGYMKKMVIADRIVIGLNTMTGDTATYTGAYVLVEVFFYAIQLYADFSGGLDMAIGAGQIFGVTLPENFERPFFSKSIKEYWNRWHITMGAWFTDYIFYPISVCKPMLNLSKWSRSHLGPVLGRRLSVYLSSFAVWLATGVWHGASWNFVFWGLSNYLVIMISQELEPLYRRFHQKFDVNGNLLYKMFQVARTFLLMGFLRMYDCFDSVLTTWRMVAGVPFGGNWNILWNGSLMQIGLTAADYVILGAGILLMFLVSMSQRSGSVREKIHAKPYAVRFVIWTVLFMVVLLTGAYGIGYDASNFIYNQF